MKDKKGFFHDEDVLVGEHEEFIEHQREKDTHRKRREFKELAKKKEQWKKNKPKGRRRRFDDDWDEYDY